MRICAPFKFQRPRAYADGVVTFDPKRDWTLIAFVVLATVALALGGIIAGIIKVLEMPRARPA